MPVEEKCAICDCIIKEEKGRRQGDDAVECSGSCSSWVHRKCVCLSKAAYVTVSKSDKPYYCPNCKLEQQELEILSLREMVTALRAEIEVLKKQIVSVLPKASIPVLVDTGATASGSSSSTVPPIGQHQVTQPLDNERRFNIVVGGIKEAPSGLPRRERGKHDLKEVMSLLSKLDESVQEASVRDHFRLGKFNPKSSRPRRILVRLTRAQEVSSILSSCVKAPSPLSVKPDLPPQARLRDAALLRERWKLLQSGTVKSDIKIRGARLLVKNKLHASFLDGKIVLEDSLSSGLPPTEVAVVLRSPDVSVSDGTSGGLLASMSSSVAVNSDAPPVLPSTLSPLSQPVSITAPSLNPPTLSSPSHLLPTTQMASTPNGC